LSLCIGIGIGIAHSIRNTEVLYPGIVSQLQIICSSVAQDQLTSDTSVLTTHRAM
jgi:hypothetical protein